MDEGKAPRGSAANRKKRTVILDDRPPLPWWTSYALISIQVFLLVMAGVVGYKVYAKINPIDKRISVEEAAGVLGVPLADRATLGVTFVKSNGVGESLNLTYKCVNCGFEGPTFAVQYPREPTVGWRAYDFKEKVSPEKIEEKVGLAPIAMAMEDAR